MHTDILGKASIGDVQKKQRLASSPWASVYVDASAGSGKTKVLTDRILRLLLKGAKISSILCITFTNAAAEEMLTRLENKLCWWLICSQEELIQDLLILTGVNPTEKEIELARQLYVLFLQREQTIRIQTIHGFCAFILKRCSVILGVDYPIDTGTIIDEVKKGNLWSEAFDAVLREALMDDTANLKDSASKLLTLFDIDSLCNLTFELTNCTTDARKYFAHLENESNLELLEQLFTQKSYDLVGACIDSSSVDVIGKYIGSLDVHTYSEFIDFVYSHGEQVQELREWIAQDQEGKLATFTRYSQFFLTSQYKPRQRLKIKSQFLERYPHIREFIRCEQLKLENLWEEIRAQQYAANASAFSIFALHVYRKYQQLKKAKRYFEYNDLIVYTIELLEDPGVGLSLLYHLGMIIDHVLVDEAQDLSALQWHLLKILTSEFYTGLGARGTANRTIFIVGDFKQSIFGFQGAQPWIFQVIKFWFKDKVINAKQIWYEIDLNMCFRCAPNILEVVDNICNNSVFSGAFPAVSEGVNRDKDCTIKHIAAHDRVNGAVELWEIPIDKKENIRSNNDVWALPIYEKNADNGLFVDEVGKQIAQVISSEIHKWLSAKRVIVGTQKPVVASDIMVLFRKRCDVQRCLVEELKKLKIGVCDLISSNMYTHILMHDLLAIAKFVLLPYDDMNLAILLKSPLIGINEDQLFTLAYKRQDFIWSEIARRASTEKWVMSCYEILSSFIATYQKFFLAHDFYNMLFNRDDKIIVEATKKAFGEYGDILLSFFMQQLFEFHYVDSGKESGTLTSFVGWFCAAMQHRSSKKVENSIHLGVKIMTVHAAKGLEAPIVILADASYSESLPPSGIIWIDDWFLVNMGSDTSYISYLKSKDNTREKEENMRLLYVALTRARSELYAAGIRDKERKNSIRNWYNIIKECGVNCIEKGSYF
ncbi:putative DNA helicase [Alphaproteobacteria bacterium]